ncbi:MAG: phosphatidylcholine/phosphatidylserine synthase [Rickettsiaceae bacterium]
MRKKIAKKPISLKKLIPNFITISALALGVTSIRLALNERWEFAVYCILIASILDGIDGRVARMLNATSPFGAELDSLCDFANFGISPAILIYLWSFHLCEFQLMTWFAILLYVACMAIRLARFNTAINSSAHNVGVMKYFSVGVPAPPGAILALMPMMLEFDIATFFDIEICSHACLIASYIILIAILLASRLPTPLLKNITIKPEYLSLIMILSAFLIISVTIYPWYSLPILSLLYIMTIPVCYVITRKHN